MYVYIFQSFIVTNFYRLSCIVIRKDSQYISFLKKILRLILLFLIQFILESIPQAARNVYYTVVGGNVPEISVGADSDARSRDYM